MKDGTSSIYVQVPIEVATFLLNEKRTDLATLEVQLKVTIVLIPNKFLETPNYSIERLKFEDPKLDENKPSYKITEQPSSEVKFVSSKDAKNKKVSQKAVIKGVATKLPAPVNKNRTNKFFNNVFRKILGLFNNKHNTKKKKCCN
jgi:ribonuclease E